MKFEQITVSIQLFSSLCVEKGLFHIVDLELVPVARAASGMDRQPASCSESYNKVLKSTCYGDHGLRCIL